MKQPIIYSVVLTSPVGTVNAWGPFPSKQDAEYWVDLVSTTLKDGTVPVVTELFKV